MGESKRKKERRREAPKPTSKLPPLPQPNDHAVAAKQQAFCASVVEKLLDDGSSLSFSKPVRELWDSDQLDGYFERIKEPMDLGTVQKALESNQYVNKDTNLFDPNAFRQQIRLVFWNAMDFNRKGTDLHTLASKFLHFVDTQMAELPGLVPPTEEQGAAVDDTAKADKEAEGAKDKPPKAKDEEVTDDKSEQQIDADHPDEEMKDKETENDRDESAPEEEDEADKMSRQIASMEKLRSRAKANLAELELVRNVPLTHEENARLRDEIERLPWEKSKKVVKVLRKYVDEALADSNEEDPEFVTLELTVVEPHLLRDIEALIRPDPRVEDEKKRIANLDEEIATLKRKLKKVASGENSSKKKPRKRR